MKKVYEIALHAIGFRSILSPPRGTEHKPATTMSITITNKPIKIDKNTYKIGKYLVNIERHTESRFACGFRKTTTWTTWSAINTETYAIADMVKGSGGIKEAAIKLS